MQNGGFVSPSASFVEKKPFDDNYKQSLNTIEALERIHECRGNSLMGILIVLPTSALLWGFLIWLGIRIFF
jgi:hypothetical protein